MISGGRFTAANNFSSQRNQQSGRKKARNRSRRQSMSSLALTPTSSKP
jgi:hypothetical protein